MGTFSVRILSQGQDIFKQYDSPYLGRANELAARYNIARMRQLEYEGADATLDFEVEQLGDVIDWEASSYPTDKLRHAIAAIVHLVPLQKALEKIKEQIMRCRFEQRDDLDDLGREALRLIENTKPSPGAPNWAFAQDEARKALKHTLGKEVELAIETKYNASKRSQNDAMAEARSYLIQDINSFLLSASLLDTGKPKPPSSIA